MRIIRWLLGSLILFFDRLFSPKEIVRDANSQASVDKQTGKLALYQYQACPFCVKVRRAMKRHSLNIETRDAKLSDSSRDELLQGGGVPVPAALDSEILDEAFETRAFVREFKLCGELLVVGHWRSAVLQGIDDREAVVEDFHHREFTVEVVL